MHLLMSLLFLLLTVGLIYLYFFLPYVLVALFRHIRRKRKSMKQGNTDAPELFWSKRRKKFAVSLAILISIASVTVYVSQRAKWMGNDNANLKAKNYYVSGQVLNSFRSILTTFIHPEIPLMAPLHKLQWVIYNQGIKYLPENDGEVGVWQNQWFHYHYSKKNRKSLGFTWRPSPKTVRLLDQWWFSLETMATKPFADKQMQEMYFQAFPSLALTYGHYKGFYSGKIIRSAKRLAKMPIHVERGRLLSDWLWVLAEKWEISTLMGEFLKKHPKIEVLRQLALLDELKGLIQGEIHGRNFSCHNESVERYIKTRQEFVNPAHGKAAYLKMREREQAQNAYGRAIEETGSRSTKYVIKTFCGVVVAGREDNSSFESWIMGAKLTLAEQAEAIAKGNYRDEIKILEEIMP